MEDKNFLCLLIWIFTLAAVMFGFTVTESASCLWALCIPFIITLKILSK